MPDYLFCIHYRADDGDIRVWGSNDGSTSSFLGPDYRIALFEQWQSVDPNTQKIDVATGELISKGTP